MRPGQGIITEYGQQAALSRHTGAHRNWAMRPGSDEVYHPLGTSQSSLQVGPAWRPPELDVGHVVVVESNFGTMGSVPRRSWEPTFNPPNTYSGPGDPRNLAWNRLVAPSTFKVTVNTAVATSTAATQGRTDALTAPMTPATPGIATLIRG